MGMTMAEKVLARASGVGEVAPGQYITAKVDQVLCIDAFVDVCDILEEVGIDRVWDPSRIVVLLDHFVPAPTVAYAEDHKSIREAVKRFGIGSWYDIRAGICHQIMGEKGHIIPGELVVGCDSHTTTYGAFGAGGTGIGVTETAYVIATGELWMRVPRTLRFILEGTLPDSVMSKDISLYIAGRYTTEVAQYRAVEFTEGLRRS